MSSGERHTEGLGTDIAVYVVLLAIAGLQIIQAYTTGGGRGLMVRLLVVAAIQALIAVMFFMHLRWERRSLVGAIALVTLFVLSAMQFSWSDSFRILHMSPWAH